MAPKRDRSAPHDATGVCVTMLPTSTDDLEIPELEQEAVLLEKLARLGVGGWDLRHAFELIAEEVARFIQHDAATFLTYHADRCALVVQATAPIGSGRLVGGIQVPCDGAIADLISGSLSAAVCMDTASSCCALECYLYRAGLTSCITIPLWLPARDGGEPRLIGLLSLGSRHRNHFTTADRAVLYRLQRPLAVAIHHLLAAEQTHTPHFFERTAELNKMRSIHELSGGIAHRLNNVLAAVLGNARLAMEANSDPRLAEYLQRLYEETLQGVSVVHAMQQFAAAQAPTTAAAVDLHEVIEGVARITDGLWHHQVEAQSIRLECSNKRRDISVALANASELREATVNLVFNAIQALPAGGTITLAAISAPPWAAIEVTDDGVGMEAEIVRRCTEPFFTTRENAYGLGLSTAAGVARKYGGHLQVHSEPGRGTTVRMMLPAADHGI
jgi:signal transduction histidine kinase